MKKTAVLLTAVLSYAGSCLAQLPTDFRTEQIFLASDRVAYTVNDTIYVDGIVSSLAHDHSGPYSRFLYVELIDPRADSVVIRKKLPCGANGVFHTDFLPEPDYSKGSYYLRAYTDFMRNFSEVTFAVNHILIGLPDVAHDSIIDDHIRCEIVPAANLIVPGLPQQVTAVLHNSTGFPVQARNLALVNSDGDTLEVRKTSATGYAIFNFIPESGQDYSLRFSAMGINKEFSLPSPRSGSGKITAALNGRRLKFAIEGDAPQQRRIFTFDRNNGLAEIPSSAPSGATTLAHKPTGPLTVFLTDMDLNIISQTSVLPRSSSTATLTIQDSISAGKGFKFEINGPESDTLTVLHRFIPAGTSEVKIAEFDITASDFDCALPPPVCATEPSVNFNELQSWLGAATFKRFRLADAVRNDSTVYTIMPEQTLTISGIVYDDENARHPMKSGRIVAYNSENFMASDTTVSKHGRFTVNVDDFEDGTEFFLQAINSKGVAVKGVIKLDDYSYPPIGILPRKTIARQRYADSETSIETGSGNPDLKELPNVVVKARVHKVEKRNDKKYYGARFIDADGFEKYNCITLLDALRKFAFARVVQMADNLTDDSTDGMKPTGDYMPYYAVVTTRIPPSVIPVILDGTLIDVKFAQYLFDMPIEQIESIEHLSPIESLMYTSSLSGAISITTKKIGMPVKKDAKGTRCWPAGLSGNNATDSKPKAPTIPGDYIFVVDIITPEGNVKSLSRRVCVTAR